MTPGAHSRTTRAGRLWAHSLWFLLAGAVVAVGVSGATSAFGLSGLFLVYAGLALFAVVTVWGLSLEPHLKNSAVLPVSLYAALDVVVLAGLCQLLPRDGLLVDKVMLERRFNDIVSQLRQSG